MLYLNKIYEPEQEGNENLTTYDDDFEKKCQGIPLFRPYLLHELIQRAPRQNLPNVYLFFIMKLN